MVNNKKDSDYIFWTDGSAIPNPGNAAYGFFGTDKEKRIYNGYGPVGTNQTNNAAELTGMLRCLQYIYSFSDGSIVTINADSKYVVDGVLMLNKWELNKWITSTGKEVANIELWKQIKVTLEQVKTKGIELTISWVRGHSGIHGNEMADQNANKGRLAMIAGENIHVCEISNQGSEEDIVTDPTVKKKKKVKAEPIIKLSPLLTGKRWFFYTNQTEQVNDGRYIYMSTAYKEIKIKKNFNLAKRNVETHYSILLTGSPIIELNTLRDKFNEAFINKTVPTLVNLQAVTKKVIWEDLVKNLNKFTKIKGNLAVAIDSTVLGEVLAPPKLAFRLEDIYNYGLELLDHYENKNKIPLTMRFHDVTKFFIIDVKGKQKLSNHFTAGLDTISLPLEILPNNEVEIKLTVDVDFPNRLKFLRLLDTTTENIKITIITHDISKTSYRLATIIEYGKELAIYYNNDSNLRLIKQ